MSTIGDLIIDSLRQHGYRCKYESGKKEVASRCPYCGGSESNKNKRQFYIKVDKPPYLFNCFRCGVSGSITKLVMDFPEIFLPVIRSIGLELLKYEVTDEEDDNVHNIESLESDVCIDCKTYLLSRISPNTLKHIEDRIVCCRTLETIDSRLSNFVGFKTIDDSTIVCRNKDDRSEFRYKNIRLSEDREFNYFVITELDDKFSSDYICVIGEGIFTTCSGIESLKKVYCESVNFVGIASLSKSRLYYTSKYVVDQLPYKFSTIYIILDNDSDFSSQLEKYIKLLKQDSRFRLLIPISGKDMNESKDNFEIKYFRRR